MKRPLTRVLLVGLLALGLAAPALLEWARTAQAQPAVINPNNLRIRGAAIGATPTLLSEGLDTNVPMLLTTQGAGNVVVTPGGAGAFVVTPTVGVQVFHAAIQSCSTDVPWSTAANLQPARVAAGDYALARTSAGAETYNVQCTLQAPFRTTASKGWRLDSFRLVFFVSVVNLTNHDTLTLQTTTYANNVANTVAAYGGALSATTFATATQANPYVTTITPGTPAFVNTAEQQVSLTYRVIMANTGVYRLYGVIGNWTTGLY